jgi:hypothetical protein
MPDKHENAPGAQDAETFDEYDERMRATFFAPAVYAATQDRPATGTYTRKSPPGGLMNDPLGAVPAPGEPGGEAARPGAIRHHARRFALFFALFVAFSAANLVSFLPGVPGIVHLVAFVGIVASIPLYLYHEVRWVKAGGRISDVVGPFTRDAPGQGR